MLLAELGSDERDALDLALDLRSALKARQDAEGCVRLALALRHALDGRHHLAFYRVRLWLQRTIVVQVRAWRGAEWCSYALPLNSARIDEIENACRAAWALGAAGGDPAWAQVRFGFRATDAEVEAPTHALSVPAA